MTALAEVHTRTDGWWKRQAEEALRVAINSRCEFTTDQLRDLGAPDLDSPKEQRAVWGSLIAAAKARGDVIRVGDRPSGRRSANGRRIAVWLGIPRAA